MDPEDEQEMEAEALEAIFDSHFTRAANVWTIDLYPGLAEDEVNYVGCRLIATLPPEYPASVPELRVHVLQGLAADEHGTLLQHLANEEAQDNVGGPSLFAVCEKLREWLAENNVKGLDDQSMHAQMLRKQMQQVKDQEKPVPLFESQIVHDVFTEAEVEDMEVRKRREEGTPCNKENFEAWKATFEAEMAVARAAHDGDTDDPKKGGKAKKDDHGAQQRLTGYQQFAAHMNFEALEAAAEQAQVGGADDDDDIDEDVGDDAEDVDDELFQEDVDLDDLDFDSSDDEVVV